MLRYKQFSEQGTALEKAVNDWLEEFEPDVTQMAQTVAVDGTISISFLFEESFRGQERRLSSESGMDSATTLTTPSNSLSDEPLEVSMESMPAAREQT